MTSLRQIESNRRNALKSTGPKTEVGKQRTSRNAVRHGLTGETVITPLEDPEDYKTFELAITADFDAETAVERELVLRLASLLWRLRRATSIETGLFEITSRQANHTQPSRERVRPLILFPELAAGVPSDDAWTGGRNDRDINPGKVRANSEPPPGSQGTTEVRIDVARCFSHLADLDNNVFERLGRYEAALWRQVRQAIFTLERTRWRTLNARSWRAQHRWQTND